MDAIPSEVPGATAEPFAAAPATPGRRNTVRTFAFFSCAVLLTGVGGMLFADLLWRTGWSAGRTVLLILYSILFFLASIGCMHGVYGFFLRRLGDRHRITAIAPYRERSLAGTNTALIFGICNEDAHQVCENLRSIFESVRDTGQGEHFDFFILSDSTRPSCWIEEERAWFEMTRELGAFGRIFYRRRTDHTGRKSGNIRDFLRTWGRRYRYFIVLDADSVMSGPTVCDLVRLMEVHPTAGLIQTAPYLVNGHSAFARFQQFASQFYGPVFNAGLNYWSQDGGNYWGHNAIIRTEPFMQFCDLPELPGRKPFGGQILSHDFVEAALLRKADWEVWFAYDLEGSYEEGPPGLIENAQRDRRWCQGNLQHFMLLFTRGFDGVSRVHLSQGILGYVSSPLWLLFMIISSYLLWFHEETGLSNIAVAPFTPFLRLTATHHALLVFCLGMAVLFLPKVLSIVDLLWDGERRRAFGGVGRASASVVAETLFSTLHAPVQMLFHTKFVLTTLLGVEVHWVTQQRAANGTTWRAAFRQHWLHTLVGFAWAGFAWRLGTDLFWWFVPFCTGLVLSAPLSVLTSRTSLGDKLRNTGLLLTREETAPPTQLARLNARMEAHALSRAGSTAALLEAVRDPYLNSLHVAMVGEGSSTGPAADSPRVRTATEKLFSGTEKLSAEEAELLASRADLMAKLHRLYWAAQRVPTDCQHPG